NELGPTIDELVQIARDGGEEKATRRTIHGWVNKGLVLRPGRAGREWRYPNAAVGQADTVARFRQRGTDPQLLRFALFIETGTIPADEAVRIARDFLSSWHVIVKTHAARFRADPEAMRDEAAGAARMRGRSPLPHRVRVQLDEREIAMTYAIAHMFSVPLSPDEEDHGAHQLERVVGLRSGRGGAERDLSDVALKPDEWPTDIDALTDAVSAASPDRIEFARRGVEAAVAWMPALRSVFVAAFGASSAPLVDILEEWSEKLTPEAYALMFSVFTSNGPARATDAEITDYLHTFHPEAFAFAMLDGRPEFAWDVVSARLRPYQRLRFDRFRAALGNQ
ncbi:MAG: hypothetical protein ACRD1H_02870, partial [Vicinamibacterales bacterium]